MASGFFVALLTALQGAHPVPLEVPDGFEVARVAGAPVVEHPLMACFDDRGGLYIAESAGLNLKPEELL